MKYLKTYQLFESKIGLTADQEAFLNECTDGTWTYDSATGLVDVKGGFDCADKGLSDFVGIKFGKVGGRFYCDRNYLTSLEGAPQEVGGNFICDAFRLEKEEWNLEGWFKVLQEGSPKAQELISTIFSAEELNKEIAKDPTGMVMKLKEIWNDENFKKTRAKLVWPKGFGEEADLVGGLNSIGF